jgi:hypothetical protein
VSSIRIATGPDRRRGVPWFWAAVVIIAALAASGWALRARTSSRASNASPRVTPAAASASTRVDDGVSLAFDVDPRTAEVFLDDVRAGSGRFAVVRPRDGHRYRVHVVASGFQPIDDVLVASSDVQWSRSLTAVAAPEVITPPPTSAPRASPAGSLSGGRRRPALDHDNPF